MALVNTGTETEGEETIVENPDRPEEDDPAACKVVVLTDREEVVGTAVDEIVEELLAPTVPEGVPPILK